jgi:hypothetical protein
VLPSSDLLVSSTSLSKCAVELLRQARNRGQSVSSIASSNHESRAIAALAGGIEREGRLVPCKASRLENQLLEPTSVHEGPLLALNRSDGFKFLNLAKCGRVHSRADL